MQATQHLKQLYWDAFAKVYSLYGSVDKPISSKHFGDIVTDFLRTSTPVQREYSIKNIFRLDVAGQGYIHFDQLGNFFLKHHCAELNLYKSHKSQRLTHKNEKKLNLHQFSSLLSESFAFLEVNVSNEVIDQIFNTHKSQNGLIIYLQYFSIFEKYFSRKFGNPETELPDIFGTLKISRVVNHAWKNFRRLYDAYVQGRSLQTSDQELRRLISVIVEDKSQADITFLLINFLRVEDTKIQFESFGKKLFIFLAQLATSDYALNTQATNRIFTPDKEYFYGNNFKFIGINQFSGPYNDRIFMVIDLDQNGTITYEEYLYYIRGFFSHHQYYGERYYIKYDDLDVEHQVPIYRLPPDPSQPKINSVHFHFSDHKFAVDVRKKIYDTLSKYDTDGDQEFSKVEVQTIFGDLLKQKQNYDQFLRNLLKYDRQGDQCLSYDQLVDFLIQYFCGELVFVKLQKITLSKQQFSELFNKIFSIFDISASQEIINTLFDQIDINKDGSIPSITYLLFLKHYLGSWSNARLQTLNYRQGKGTNQNVQNILTSLDGLTPTQKFTKIIVEQLKKIFFNYDTNKNLTFQLYEVKQILEKVFSLQDNDVSYILFNFFNFRASNNGVTFEHLISIVLLNYFVGILLKNKYQNKKDSTVWKEKKLQANDFISLLADGCFFLKVKPSTEILAAVFQSIDSEKKGFITFGQYTAFIKHNLANDIDIAALNASKTKNTQASQQEIQFSQKLWARIRKYFQHYDNGNKGALTQEELAVFIQQVLHSYSRKNIDSLFWNLFLVDQTANRSVEFSEFGQLVINNSAEVALHQFLHNKPKGSNEIKPDQIYSLVRNSFSFLQTISKETKVIDKSLKRIKSANGSVQNYAYLNWVHKTISIM